MKRSSFAAFLRLKAQPACAYTILGLVLLWSWAPGVVAEPAEFVNFQRFAGESAWGYSDISDPTGLSPAQSVQRFELRPQDCLSVPPYNDCEKDAERAEQAQLRRPGAAVSGSEWYQWNIFFPPDFVNSYPARTRHGQFVEHGRESPAWVLEVGSTGVLWLGSQFDDDPRYYSLVDEQALRGKWHEIIINVDWSASKGALRLWVDGVLKADHDGATCNSCRIFFSYGIHRTRVSTFNERFPERTLPTQVVLYTQPQATLTDPGWILVDPPPSPASEPASTIQSEDKVEPSESLEPQPADEVDEVTGESQSPVTDADEPVVIIKNEQDKEEENASPVLPEPEEPTTPTEDEDQTVDAVQVLKPSDIPSDRR